MKKHTRLGIVVASAAAVSLALTACGQTGSDTGGSAAGSVEPPASLTWMTMLHTPATPEADGPVAQALAEYTGTEVDFQWVPDASKDEKINAALASDSLAELTSLTNTANTSVRQALRSGQFWDVEKYLADYDNLAAIDKNTIASAKVDGKLYGVPYQKPVARYGVIIRQDWLDNLGLEVPHTLDDLADVALAFTNDDPDGNGVADTTGFIDRAESAKLGFRMISGYFGAGNNFEVTDDDEVVPSFQTDAYMDAMEWYRDLYEQGAVNQEFVTVQKQNQQDAIAQNKGGIVVTGLMDTKNYMALAKSADPNTPMEWAMVNDMTYDDVPRRILSDTAGGFGGLLAISKTKVKTEDEVRGILAFIDKLIDEEAFGLMTNGIEGTHYSTEDDTITILDQPLWEQEVQPYAASRPSELVKTFNSTTPYANESAEKIAENAEFVVVDPAQPLSSDTYDRSWSTIQQGAIDAYNKYMVGQLDMAGYKDAIDSLGGQGLDSIVEEFTAAYAEVN